MSFLTFIVIWAIVHYLIPSTPKPAVKSPGLWEAADRMCERHPLIGNPVVWFLVIGFILLGIFSK